MPGQVNCIFTKALLPFIEREVGPEGVAALLRAAGRPREYLAAEYNTIPLEAAERLVRLSMELMGEPDEDRWARRYGEDFMDWKPSREERAWGGTYTMSLGSPRAVYEKLGRGPGTMAAGSWIAEIVDLRRRRARVRFRPVAGVQIPRWLCTWHRVCFERFPTNWQLPRARIVEHACAARGDTACTWEIHWKNALPGARFWGPAAAGAAMAGAAVALAVAQTWPLATGATVAALSIIAGAGFGYGLLKAQRDRQSRRLLDLQSEEILYSSRQLEKKFRDLEAKLEQLSLLIDLSRAVNASLDPEAIYDQTLQRLVHAMGYQAALLFLADHERRVLRGHRRAGVAGTDAPFEGHEVPLNPQASGSAKAVVTGEPVLVNDVDAAREPVHLPTVRAFNVRSFLAVPLRVKERVSGVLSVVSSEVDRFAQSDLELVSAVANHVALAIDKAESFQTIEGLSRGLEEKVRVRTEQLRAANDELQAAYRTLQATQMQLVQREKMASVGQLVAGVAHELNNPIGFIFSNVSTLEDFVRRLRAMLDAYRVCGEALPDVERKALAAEWDTLKVDYVLKYLDSMIQGIREGAERTRKIVRDLRVFARTGDEVWQAVDLHEELESSLTLLNHLLKDRVTVHRKFGDLPSVEGIRSQIDQVFLNILANAAQAIVGPGAITIETRRENSLAVVSITDTGPGIAPEVIGRVFDPFFTTKPVGEGTGLGLSISYEIIKKHGGEITAESRPGQGATLTVRLPLSRAR